MKEEISEFVDGETASEHYDAVIAHLTDDDAAKGAWGRYHLIGDVLRGAHGESNQAPATQDANVVPLPAAESRAFRPLTGLAIAASVTVLAVVFVLRSSPDPVSPALELADRPAPAAAARPDLSPPMGYTAAVPAGDARRLEGYLVNFNEQRSRHGVPGVHPYVRIVSFDAQ